MVFSVRVSGNTGQPFAGSLKVWNGNLPALCQEIEGAAPTEYRFEGTKISVDLRNGEEMGLLKVEILKDERVVSTSMMAGGGGTMSATAS